MGNITEGGAAEAAPQINQTTATPPAPVEVSRLRSADFAKLAGALAKAQLRIGNAEKNAENPHFKKPYADLASIREAFRIPLAENDIAFTQVVSTNSRGEMVVTTMLLHVSGQYLEGSIRFKAEDNNPQGTGSKLTYMKRYAAAAITGVAASDDDDDGEGAQGRGQSQQNRGRETAPARQAQARQPAQQPQSSAKPAEPPAEAHDPAQLATIKLAWEDAMKRATDAATLKAIAGEIGKGPFPKGSEEWTALLATYGMEMKRIDPAWKPTGGRK